MIHSRVKILLIRFSSMGDVTQCLSVPTRLAELSQNANLEIHWVTREDMADLIQGHPFVSRIWTLNKNKGIKGLLQLAYQLKKERFTHIYDAHNNLRSLLIRLLLSPPLAITRIFDPPLVLVKSQNRWKRFLLFQFRINQFQQPFSGQRDLLQPLRQWGLSEELPPSPQIAINPQAMKKAKDLLQRKNIDLSKLVVFAPSAAYELKRWPKEHFKKLIELLPGKEIVCVGGTQDEFIAEFEAVAPERVHNFAGKTSLQETAALISLARYIVSNDTGSLHLAEQLGKPTAALMGPAPFGFPSRSSTDIFQIDLACRPCSKHGQGPCINQVYQKCMVAIEPTAVAEKVLHAFT